ncbi:MAG: class A sortase [Lactovum sp.]
MKKRKWKFIALLILFLLFIDIILFMDMRKKEAKSTNENQLSQSLSSFLADKKQVDSKEFDSLFEERIKEQVLPVIGAMVIPDLKINLPIFEGEADAQILHGAGKFGTGDFGIGNLALASHHVFYVEGAETYLFSPLVKAEKKMMIYLTDKKYTYHYEIDKIFVVDEHDTYILKSDEKSIVSLVYCTQYDSPERGIIQASLISKEVFSETDEEIKSYFKSEYNQVPDYLLSSLSL